VFVISQARHSPTRKAIESISLPQDVEANLGVGRFFYITFLPGRSQATFPQMKSSIANFPKYETLHSHFESSPDIL
jgi:hypothetical protein